MQFSVVIFLSVAYASVVHAFVTTDRYRDFTITQQMTTTPPTVSAEKFCEDNCKLAHKKDQADCIKKCNEAVEHSTTTTTEIPSETTSGTLLALEHFVAGVVIFGIIAIITLVLIKIRCFRDCIQEEQPLPSDVMLEPIRYDSEGPETVINSDESSGEKQAVVKTEQQPDTVTTETDAVEAKLLEGQEEDAVENKPDEPSTSAVPPSKEAEKLVKEEDEEIEHRPETVSATSETDKTLDV